MPRRTVQEVTVQDVQKRRIPNKHYVSLTETPPAAGAGLVWTEPRRSSPLSVGQSENKERIKLQPAKTVEKKRKWLLVV